MADWSADNNGVLKERGQLTSNGTNTGVIRQNSRTSSLGSKSSMSEKISLDDGDQLTEESRTDSYLKSIKHRAPNIPPRHQSNGLTNTKPPAITLTPMESTAEESLTIPTDGCLYGFTADQMSLFFKHLRIDDRYINYMSKKGITGKKFSNLKDTELDNLGINNPIVCFFREKSKRKKAAFML